MILINSPLLALYIDLHNLLILFLVSGNKRPATEHAAVWVPDSEAHTCMHCLKVKFTPIQRRVCHVVYVSVSPLINYCIRGH